MTKKPSSYWGYPHLWKPLYIYILIYRLRKSDEQIVESLQLRLPSWWIKLFIFVWGGMQGFGQQPWVSMRLIYVDDLVDLRQVNS